jgi:NADP-dependent 3-hydroxy acid dehydrogenase YdfG
MNRKLENKAAVVTGDSGGLASAPPKHFTGVGAQVFINGRRPIATRTLN